MMTSNTYRRQAVAGTFITLSAFMNLVRSLTALALGTYQAFSVDKALIKRLYSLKDNKKPAKSSLDELDQYMDDNQRRVKKSI